MMPMVLGAHMMQLAPVSMSHAAYSIINGTIMFLDQDDRGAA